jgi:hypothetical protein
MRLALMRALWIAWASPASAVGLVLGVLALLLGARARWVDGALEFAGGRLPRRMVTTSRYRFAAITLGHVILGTDETTLEHCRAHEHVHVRQYERWGVLFFPLYLGSTLAALARGRDPYLDNRFERAAFAATASPVDPPTRRDRTP